MPGVRIQPRPDRVAPDNALIVVRDVTRPFPQPKDGQRLEAVQEPGGASETEATTRRMTARRTASKKPMTVMAPVSWKQTLRMQIRSS